MTVTNPIDLAAKIISQRRSRCSRSATSRSQTPLSSTLYLLALLASRLVTLTALNKPTAVESPSVSTMTTGQSKCHSPSERLQILLQRMVDEL